MGKCVIIGDVETSGLGQLLFKFGDKGAIGVDDVGQVI
jgi:hypothetical protein